MPHNYQEQRANAKKERAIERLYFIRIHTTQSAIDLSEQLLTSNIIALLANETPELTQH